jgi:hypothetical protein
LSNGAGCRTEYRQDQDDEQQIGGFENQPEPPQDIFEE